MINSNTYGGVRFETFKKIFVNYLKLDTLVELETDFKSRLIEWTQKTHKVIEFKLVSEEMRKEGAFFLSEVYIDNVLYGSGDGFSKRESQQKAARQAISKLGI